MGNKYTSATIRRRPALISLRIWMAPSKSSWATASWVHSKTKGTPSWFTESNPMQQQLQSPSSSLLRHGAVVKRLHLPCKRCFRWTTESLHGKPFGTCLAVNASCSSIKVLLFIIFYLLYMRKGQPNILHCCHWDLLCTLHCKASSNRPKLQRLRAKVLAWKSFQRRLYCCQDWNLPIASQHNTHQTDQTPDWKDLWEHIGRHLPSSKPQRLHFHHLQAPKDAQLHSRLPYNCDIERGNSGPGILCEEGLRHIAFGGLVHSLSC